MAITSYLAGPMRRVKTESLALVLGNHTECFSAEGGLIWMTVGQQAIDELAIRDR